MVPASEPLNLLRDLVCEISSHSNILDKGMPTGAMGWSQHCPWSKEWKFNISWHSTLAEACFETTLQKWTGFIRNRSLAIFKGWLSLIGFGIYGHLVEGLRILIFAEYESSAMSPRVRQKLRNQYLGPKNHFNHHALNRRRLGSFEVIRGEPSLKHVVCSPLCSCSVYPCHSWRMVLFTPSCFVIRGEFFRSSFPSIQAKTLTSFLPLQLRL